MCARTRAALALAALVAWAAPTAGGDAATAANEAAPAGILSVLVHEDADRARTLREILGGAPAVVSVWASYCAPCRAEVPVLREAIRRWKDAHVRVVAVAADVHDPKRMSDLRESWGIDYQTYWVSADLEPRIEALLPAGLPTTFFVKGDHVVRYDRLLTTESLEALAHQHLGLDTATP